MWKGSSSGDFSAKEFTRSFETRHPEVDWARCIWLRWLPPKISIFMWRLLLSRLPIDELIRKLGIPITSRCMCCFNNEERLNHLFFNGKWAADVWKYIHINLGVQAPTGINSFRRLWIPKFKAKRYFHCLCFGLACCGLWEVWRMRNARVHGEREYCLVSTMDNWFNKLRSVIPAGALSRKESYIIDNMNTQYQFRERPVWYRWCTSEQGNWMHIAIVVIGDTCKSGALFRDQEGNFIHAMVRPMHRTSAMREFMNCVEYYLCEARNRSIKVRHIISSHECSFRFSRDRPKGVPWEAMADTRRIDADHGPLDWYRVTASANNAALCLTYSNQQNTDISNFGELSLALKRCILADKMALPALVIGAQTDEDYNYPGGGIEDDGSRLTRRSRVFSDDMGLDN